MHDEQTFNILSSAPNFMDQQTAEESDAKERYEYFTRPEPRENLSEIYYEDDPYLGPKTRCRDLLVGMVRNATDENRKAVKAYLDPYPHIRIDNAKPLQGWYQGAVNDSPQSRPRPCFTEAILTEPYGGYCLAGDTRVATTEGPVAIRDIKPHHVVYGERDGQLVESPVVGWMVSGRKPITKLKTSVGSIRVSGDHPIYSEDRNDYIDADRLEIGENLRCLEEGRLSRLFNGSRNRSIRESSTLVCYLSGRLPITSEAKREKSFGNLDLPLLRSGGNGAVQFMYCMPNRRSDSEGSKSEREDLGEWSSIGRNKEKNFGYAYRTENVSRELRINSEESQAYTSARVSSPVGSGVSVSLGVLGGRVPRPAEYCLGLRSREHQVGRRRNLHSRLQTGQRIVHRGKRVHGFEIPLQNSESKTVGVRYMDMGRKTAKTSWDIGRVISKEVGAVEKVYDIETTTGNFVIITDEGCGVLVHNCAVGCQFSLPSSELVDTPDGPKSIESFKTGDAVYGRTVIDRRIVLVTGTTRHWKPEGLVQVRLSDGRVLRMTGDHPVYSRNRGWIAADRLVRGEKLEDVSMSRLRDQITESSAEVVQALLVSLQSTKEDSVEILPGLRNGNTEKSVGLRCLQFTNQIGQRLLNEGERAIRIKGSEIRRNQSEDVSVCVSASRRNGQKSEGAEVCRVSFGESRRCKERQIRVSTIQAPSIYRPEGADVSDAIYLGSLSCSLARQFGKGLGLRTDSFESARRIGLLVGFQNPTERGLFGSQRVYDAGRSREDSAGERVGILDSHNGPETNGASGNPYVKEVTRVPGGVWVYDIETETGNFYQQGILVHNCYINSGMRGYRGTGLISVPLDYGDQIAKQLTKVNRAAAGYFSSFTDPFTPLESYYHNTQLAAEEFVKVGLPIFFLSRLRYPDWAVDLLTKNPHSYAQKSINTCDPEDWRRLSPGALPLTSHLKDITRLKKRGIYISIQCNPIVPGITSNEQIVELFKMLADAGADHVIVKFVEAAYSWAPAMVARLKKVFGEERGSKFEELFTQNIGSQRTVDEDYRLRAHRLYSSYARRYGLTYATCYEYRYERDDDGKILSKTGISIGREFTTASQCHGHRVPMYRRVGERFKPLDECPPSGCLYCAAENNGEPRCGDELAGQGKALRLVDLKVPFNAK